MPAPFSASARGFLQVPRGGAYGLSFHGDGAGTVAVNGEVVLAPPARATAQVELAPGSHRWAIDLEVAAGNAGAELLWTPPGAEEPQQIPPRHLFSPDLPAGGLLGSYHHGAHWDGEPAIARVDSGVAFYFHELPLPRPFSVRWTGRIYAPAGGDYQFELNSIDDSVLLVDGEEAAAQRASGRTSRPLGLDLGWHRIEVRYSTVNDYSQVYLYWTPPGGDRVLVPAVALSPPGPSGRVVLDDDRPGALAPAPGGRTAAPTP